MKKINNRALDMNEHWKKWIEKKGVMANKKKECTKNLFKMIVIMLLSLMTILKAMKKRFWWDLGKYYIISYLRRYVKNKKIH
jgi:membrane protein required for beta-lactamase induction